MISVERKACSTPMSKRTLTYTLTCNHELVAALPNLTAILGRRYHNQNIPHRFITGCSWQRRHSLGRQIPYILHPWNEIHAVDHIRHVDTPTVPDLTQLTALYPHLSRMVPRLYHQIVDQRLLLYLSILPPSLHPGELPCVAFAGTHYMSDVTSEFLLSHTLLDLDNPSDTTLTLNPQDDDMSRSRNLSMEKRTLLYKCKEGGLVAHHIM